MSREGRSSRNRVSVLNWMWTIVLACIPGVNIIALFLLAFLSKKQPKRTFAAAALVLMLIVAILIFVAFLVFPSELLSFGEWLPEGKEMLVVSGAVLQIGDTRLPVSVDWVPQDQGETFSFEAELALLGEAPFKENAGMMEAALLIQSHLYGGENEQSTVTFAFAAPQ